MVRLGALHSGRVRALTGIRHIGVCTLLKERCSFLNWVRGKSPCALEKAAIKGCLGICIRQGRRSSGRSCRCGDCLRAGAHRGHVNTRKQTPH